MDEQYSGVIPHTLCNPLPVLCQMEICRSDKANVEGQTVCAIGHMLPFSQSEGPGSAQVQSLLYSWWQRCTSKYCLTVAIPPVFHISVLQDGQ